MWRGRHTHSRERLRDWKVFLFQLCIFVLHSYRLYTRELALIWISICQNERSFRFEIFKFQIQIQRFSKGLTLVWNAFSLQGIKLPDLARKTFSWLFSLTNVLQTFSFLQPKWAGSCWTIYSALPKAKGKQALELWSFGAYGVWIIWWIVPGGSWLSN